MVTKELRNAISLMLSPGNATKKSMKIGEAFAFYYKATLIPLVAYIIISLILSAALTATAGAVLASIPYVAPLLGIGLLAAIVVPIVVVWILIPIFAIIWAGILQIIGKALGVFKSDFENTLSAVVYGRFPVGVFSFLYAIPFASLAMPVFDLWSLVVQVVGLSNQQKLKWPAALGMVIISGTIVLAIIAIIASLLFIALGGSLLGWVMHHTSSLGITSV